MAKSVLLYLDVLRQQFEVIEGYYTTQEHLATGRGLPNDLFDRLHASFKTFAAHVILASDQTLLAKATIDDALSNPPSTSSKNKEPSRLIRHKEDTSIGRKVIKREPDAASDTDSDVKDLMLRHHALELDNDSLMKRLEVTLAAEPVQNDGQAHLGDENLRAPAVRPPEDTDDSYGSTSSTSDESFDFPAPIGRHPSPSVRKLLCRQSKPPSTAPSSTAQLKLRLYMNAQEVVNALHAMNSEELLQIVEKPMQDAKKRGKGSACEVTLSDCELQDDGSIVLIATAKSTEDLKWLTKFEEWDFQVASGAFDFAKPRFTAILDALRLPQIRSLSPLGRASLVYNLERQNVDVLSDNSKTRSITSLKLGNLAELWTDFPSIRSPVLIDFSTKNAADRAVEQGLHWMGHWLGCEAYHTQSRVHKIAQPMTPEPANEHPGDEQSFPPPVQKTEDWAKDILSNLTQQMNQLTSSLGGQRTQPPEVVTKSKKRSAKVASMDEATEKKRKVKKKKKKAKEAH